MVISMGPVWYYQRHNIHGGGFFLLPFVTWRMKSGM